MHTTIVRNGHYTYTCTWKLSTKIIESFNNNNVQYLLIVFYIFLILNLNWSLYELLILGQKPCSFSSWGCMCTTKWSWAIWIDCFSQHSSSFSWSITLPNKCKGSRSPWWHNGYSWHVLLAWYAWSTQGLLTTKCTHTHIYAWFTYILIFYFTCYVWLMKAMSNCLNLVASIIIISMLIKFCWMQ